MNYQKLSDHTLEIVVNVLQSLGPLSLKNEPADCVSAFSEFISERVKELNYHIDTEEKTRAVVRFFSRHPHPPFLIYVSHIDRLLW